MCRCINLKDGLKDKMLMWYQLHRLLAVKSTEPVELAECAASALRKHAVWTDVHPWSSPVTMLCLHLLPLTTSTVLHRRHQPYHPYMHSDHC